MTLIQKVHFYPRMNCHPPKPTAVIANYRQRGVFQSVNTHSSSSQSITHLAMSLLLTFQRSQHLQTSSRLTVVSFTSSPTHLSQQERSHRLSRFALHPCMTEALTVSLSHLLSEPVRSTIQSRNTHAYVRTHTHTRVPKHTHYTHSHTSLTHITHTNVDLHTRACVPKHTHTH